MDEISNKKSSKSRLSNKSPKENLLIRLPYGMRDKLSEIARIYHRSTNAEIVSRLEQSLNLISDIRHAREIENTAQKTSMLIEIFSDELALVKRFRALSMEKQKSLLVLLDCSLA